MQPISPLVRLTLGAIAAGLATLMAPDVFGILPTWAQVLIGFASAVLAFMLLPLDWQPNEDRSRAFKRGTPQRREPVDVNVRHQRNPSPPPKKRRVAIIGALTGALLLMLPVASAHAVTGAQATALANGWTADDCPHHTFGKCIKRRLNYVSGIGGGRWTYDAHMWENTALGGNSIWDARWIYGITCTITSAGARTGCSRYGDW